MNQNIDFDELFALRLHFQDAFEDENDIIRELKYVLLDKGILSSNIPGLLKDFYEQYGITITIEQIKEALNNQYNPQFNSGQNMENNILQLLNNYIQQQIEHTVHAQENLIEQEDNDDQEEDDNDQEENDDQEEDDDDQEENDDQEEDDDQVVDLSGNQQNVDPSGNQQNVDSSGNTISLENQVQQLFVTMSSGLNGPSFQIVSGNNHGIPFNIGSGNIASNNLLPFNPLDSLLNNLFQPMLPPLVNFGYDGPMMQQMTDVRTTLDDEDSNNIKRTKVENKLEKNCIICMSAINKDEESSELPCTHYFHSECIEPWLKEYNYKCPICRKEVGKPKYNI
jgi:hypothetical protein